MTLVLVFICLCGATFGQFTGLNKSDAEIVVDVTQAEANMLYIKNSFPEWWSFCMFPILLCLSC
jgi:hypothetical protein